jgi:hypothetical protein
MPPERVFFTKMFGENVFKVHILKTSPMEKFQPYEAISSRGKKLTDEHLEKRKMRYFTNITAKFNYHTTKFIFGDTKRGCKQGFIR